MNRVEHLLSNLAEEAAELAQAVEKAKRFGLQRVHPGQPFSNAEKIMHEYADIVGVMTQLLAFDKVLQPPADFGKRSESKRTRMLDLMQVARDSGALID